MTQAIRLAPAAALLAAMLGASGCATKPPTPEERAAVWLSEAPRYLAVHVNRDLPPPELHSRDHKVGQRVGKGAAYGAGAAVYGIGYFCAMAPPLGCIVGIAATPITFIGGAVYGAASVDSVDSYQPIEAAKGAPALFAPANGLNDLPDLLEESVVAKADALGRHVVFPERSKGQGGARRHPDGKLELSFRAFDFFGDAGDDPSVALVLDVTADLATMDNESVQMGDFTYQSPAHNVSGWKADGARLFREETDKAIRDIAAQIAERLDSSPSIIAKRRVANARSNAIASAEVAHEAPAPIALAAPAEPRAEAHTNGLFAAGTSWTYELTDGIFGGGKSRIGVRVTSADDTFVREEVSVIAGTRKAPAVSRTIAARETSFDLYRLDADRALTEFAPYLLAAGGEGALESVSGAKGYPTSGYSGWVTQSEPPVWDQVTVPAGTFRALRFELRGRRQIPPYTSVAVQRFEIRVWYAPEVKRYVRLEHKTWLSGKRPDGDDVVELVEYRPHS